MDIKTGNFKYSGGELVKRLKTYWSDAFARSVHERQLCSGLDIIRWMVVTLGQHGIFTTKGMHLELVRYALTDFPIREFSDAQTRREYQEIITLVYSNMAKFGRSGNPPDLFDILENKMMTDQFWSNPSYLLYKTTAYEDRGESIQDIKLSAEEIARGGLIRIQYPEDLPTAIANVLAPSKCEGKESYQFHVPTPPLFIRVLWDNALWAALDRRSPVQTLQQLQIEYDDVQVGNNNLVFSKSSTSYRLICLAKISLPNEEPVAVHLYNCDGSHFLPPYGNNQDQNWSCQEPGKYYLMYYKSDEPRYWSETGPLVETEQTFADVRRLLKKPKMPGIMLPEQHSAPGHQPTSARPAPHPTPSSQSIQKSIPVPHSAPGSQFIMKSIPEQHSAPGIRPTAGFETEQPVADIRRLMKKPKMIGIMSPEQHSAPGYQPTVALPAPHTAPGSQSIMKSIPEQHSAPGIRPTAGFETEQPVADIRRLMKKPKMIGIMSPEQHSAPGYQPTVARPAPHPAPGSQSILTSIPEKHSVPGYQPTVALPVPHVAPGPHPIMKSIPTPNPAPITRPTTNPSPVPHPAPGSQIITKSIPSLYPAPSPHSGSSASGRIGSSTILYDDKHGPLKHKKQDNLIQENATFPKSSLSLAPSRSVKVVKFQDTEEHGEDDEDEGEDEDRRPRFRVPTPHPQKDRNIKIRMAEKDLVLVPRVPTLESIGKEIRNAEKDLVLVPQVLTLESIGKEIRNAEKNLVLVPHGVTIAQTAIDDSLRARGMNLLPDKFQN
ncbi:hypothetical protein F5Y00DRAFT_274583 [Daldinia vernicosa]|uniref:uncharacterized protein n=1 Tax=Daldinia vernicosa TaxID=114800 RepID=UPI002008CC09|nr:uncharacterized protein F5Y00DRAFT_274583 [Daldinia vernicosa]KAI0851675.1 hypothetical protein F5Y00DRAFT_274583 [Daldinia vernicosa]